jgi:hypothetical protein
VKFIKLKERNLDSELASIIPDSELKELKIDDVKNLSEVIKNSSEKLSKSATNSKSSKGKRKKKKKVRLVEDSAASMLGIQQTQTEKSLALLIKPRGLESEIGSIMGE